MVLNADIPGTGRLIPLHHVTRTAADRVELDLSRAQVLAADHFIVPDRLPTTPNAGTLAAYWLGPVGGPTFAVQERLPSETEIAVRSKPRVRTSDGHHVGTVAEVLIESNTGAITNLLLREGHVFGRRDVVVPVSAIAAIDRDGVRLNLDRSALDALPAGPT